MYMDINAIYIWVYIQNTYAIHVWYIYTIHMPYTVAKYICRGPNSYRLGHTSGIYKNIYVNIGSFHLGKPTPGNQSLNFATRWPPKGDLALKQRPQLNHPFTLSTISLSQLAVAISIHTWTNHNSQLIDFPQIMWFNPDPVENTQSHTL